MPEVTVPHNFEPRPYQLPLLQALDDGVRRLVAVWHRRAGKDKTILNAVIKEMSKRVGVYFYYFPTAAQGRKILWDGIDKTGMPFLKHFPGALIKKKHEQEMKITLKNGSLFQIIGTDKNEVVGTNPVGCVFSEYSLQNPQAWNYVRPILAENGGFAIFNFTPRGKNHGYELYKMAKTTPEWFVSLLTVNDTGAISKEAIELERKSGMSDEMIEQEFYCSFDCGVTGAYYGKYITEALNAGRVCSMPVDEQFPVFTFWDLGIGDSMSIWFAQFAGAEIHLVDYYEASGYGLKHYAEILQNKGYFYGGHFAPHDINAREMSVTDENGRAMRRIDAAVNLGIKFERVPNELSVDDGIEAARGILSRCWFDKVKCEHGVNCLSFYHKVYNEKLKVFERKPEHDWSSHCADAFRTLAVARRTGLIKHVSVRETASREELQSVRNDFSL
jgi:hypothetical protein